MKTATHTSDFTETSRCSHVPEGFQPRGEVRGRFESEIGPSVSNTSRFLRALSHRGPAYVDSWRNPAQAALGATGEELQLLPHGNRCLARAVLTVSASVRHAGCLQVSGSEIVESLTINQHAFPHRSYRSWFVPFWFPLPPLMWEKTQQRLKGLRKTHIYIYVYDAGKAKTLKKVFPPLTGCTRAWHI